MAITRRSFLKASSFTLAASSLASITALLGSAQTQAAPVEGYKAMVCLFFFGGMDNHDTVIPYDQQNYQRWAQIRQSIIDRQTVARTRENLLPITPLNAAQFAGREFALPPEFSGIRQLFQQGNAAIVANVGPLIEPITANQLEQDQVALPARLFSHNDQQSTWMSGATEGSQFGWGGLYTDSIANMIGDTTFANITTGGAELFITGRTIAPYIVSGGEAPTIAAIDSIEKADRESLVEHFSVEYFQSGTLLQQDIANKVNHSFVANKLYNTAIQQTDDVNIDFPDTPLGRQLASVVNAIAARESLGTSRQIFSVSMGGFDTHSDQAVNLPELQQQIDESVVAFYQAMVALGLHNDVTLFTASDFGRTLANNGDGTDHGWGSHHFVIGGAVQGQQIFGDIPEPTFNHPLDAGNGRLIPSQSVDQYAAALGQWFGIEQNELNRIFPNLVNFAAPPNLFSV